MKPQPLTWDVLQPSAQVLVLLLQGQHLLLQLQAARAAALLLLLFLGQRGRRVAVGLGGSGRAPPPKAVPQGRNPRAGLRWGTLVPLHLLMVLMVVVVGAREEVALERVREDPEDGRSLVWAGMALPGLLVHVRGGGALLGRRAVKPLDLRSAILQLDVRGERGGGGGGGRLQETAVVEEAEDAAALLSEGIEDKTIL